MCSYFLRRMENYQGDLTDIIRSTARGGDGGGGSFSGEFPLLPDWQFPADPMNYPSGMEEPGNKFGDPFSNMRDPLLHELDIPSSAFFNNSNNSTSVVEDSTSGFGTVVGVASDGGVVHAHQKILDEDQMKRPCNIFSTMLQISPNDSPILDQSASLGGIIKNSPLVSGDLISANASKNCLVESTTAGVQISSPRNMGIKRRKSQAKKVVCIPAPAPANSRPSGEVVPSDLWAWRKYGQKPIKGSPYPRGYYRCSSSKGCSARKQVERSRTDPNMLVITYTSEHNHPWPTQRNALAGSTRTQPSKNNNSASKNSSAVGSQKGITSSSIKEEQDEEEEEEEEEAEEEKESNQRTDHNNGPYSGSSSTTATTRNKIVNPPVKEEKEGLEKQQMQREMDGDREGEFSSEGFPQSYRPALPGSCNLPSEDFFADFGEMEGDDPINLLLTQGLIPGDDDEDRDKYYNKALDPFSSLFDWTGSSNSSSSNTNNSNNNLTRRGL